MTFKDAEAIRRANDAILMRMAGLPAQRGTPETDAELRHLTELTELNDAERSEPAASAQSSPAPQNSAPPIRLVWDGKERV